MMYIYVTLTNMRAAVCTRHLYLADGRGWSFLEQREREDDWPCYFAYVDTFWHEANGQRFLSRSMTEALQAEATTLARYREIVKRAYGNLRGVTFGTETEQGNTGKQPKANSKR